jgi:hypothetical protein
MKIIFFHIGETSMPTMLAKSIIKHGHEPVFLTDLVTADIPGCETHRYDSTQPNVIRFRMESYAKYNQPGIYLDSDMLVMHDLTPIMGLDFDVALTKVSHVIIDPEGVNLTEVMPYNGGFIAVKDQSFLPAIWNMAECHKDDNVNEWFTDQVILAKIAKTRHVVELPVKIYNRTVKRPDVDTTGAWILHFKGNGKPLMEEYAKDILWK